MSPMGLRSSHSAVPAAKRISYHQDKERRNDTHSDRCENPKNSQMRSRRRAERRCGEERVHLSRKGPALLSAGVAMCDLAGHSWRERSAYLAMVDQDRRVERDLDRKPLGNNYEQAAQSVHEVR
jgi:hypothetical protein